MSPEEIPDSLIEILDKRAGKAHSRQGPVVECLAEILTEYDRLLVKRGIAERMKRK